MRYPLKSLKLALPIVLSAVMLLGTADRASAQTGPCLAVMPDTLRFHGNICGEYLTPQESDSQYVIIYNCGDGLLEWTVSYDQNWVWVAPDSGLGSDSVAVGIKWGYLPDFFPPPPPGDTIMMEATLSVTALGVIDSPQYVTVLLFLYCEPGQKYLAVQPLRLDLTVAVGDTLSRDFFVFETHGDSIEFWHSNNSSWLSLPLYFAPLYTPQNCFFYVSTEGLAPGMYYDTVFLWSTEAANSPVKFPVTLTVHSPIPVVRTRPERFDFFLFSGDTLRNQALLVYEESGATLPYHFETVFGSEWLQITPPDTPFIWPYVTPSSMLLDIPTGDLTPGVYADTIVIYNPMDDTLWYEDVRVPVTLTIAGEPGPYVVETRPTEFHFMLTEDEVTVDSLLVYEIHDHHVGFLYGNGSSWLTLNPFGMPPYATPTSLTMIVHSDSLPPGIYVDTIFIFSAFGPPFAEVAVPVTLTVPHYLPVVKASPTRFDFSLSPGDSLLRQGMLVYEENGDAIPYFVETMQGSEWLRIQYPLILSIPVTPDSIYFNIYSDSLPPGVYADTIVIYNPTDDTLWYDEVKVPVVLFVDSSSYFVCGDIDNDGQGPDISDLVYLVHFMFGFGPPPPVLWVADVNGTGGPIDIADLVYLIDYMFRRGDPLTCPGHPGK